MMGDIGGHSLWHELKGYQILFTPQDRVNRISMRRLEVKYEREMLSIVATFHCLDGYAYPSSNLAVVRSPSSINIHLQHYSLVGWSCWSEG